MILPQHTMSKKLLLGLVSAGEIVQWALKYTREFRSEQREYVGVQLVSA